jgi:hypothetical protein
MQYEETIKRSQTQQNTTGGFTKRLSCKYVKDVRNEENEALKFSYDTNDEVLTILENNFKLLTVIYIG